MTRSEINQVLDHECEVAVSIYAPTHLNFPDNKADAILVRNLLRKAEAEILEKMEKRSAQPIVENLASAFGSVNFDRTTEGLAILASERGFFVFHLNHRPIEQCTVASQFSIAELVRSSSLARQYHLLVLSESPTRLFRGDGKNLREIKGEFPIEHTGRGGSQGLPTDFGQQTSVIEDEEHRKFFRKVAEALSGVQSEEELPLIVTGVTRFQSFWSEVSKQKPALTIEGSYDFMTESELVTKLFSEIEGFFKAEDNKIVDELVLARNKKLYAGGVSETLEVAQAGRIETLVVSETETANRVVEETVRLTVKGGGRVFFLPSAELAGFSEVASSLRF